MTLENTKTFIISPAGKLILTLDGFLYQPMNCIIIGEEEYHEWHQYDTLYLGGWVIRKIRLK